MRINWIFNFIRDQLIVYDVYFNTWSFRHDILASDNIVMVSSHGHLDLSHVFQFCSWSLCLLPQMNKFFLLQMNDMLYSWWWVRTTYSTMQMKRCIMWRPHTFENADFETEIAGPRQKNFGINMCLTLGSLVQGWSLSYWDLCSFWTPIQDSGFWKA